MERKAYPSDVSDEEWTFVAPYLSSMTEEARQREHSLREVFKGLRWIIRAGASWRMMPFGFAVAHGGKPSCSAVSPHDLPLWAAVHQQSQRWFRAGVFEAIVDDPMTVANAKKIAKFISRWIHQDIRWDYMSLLPMSKIVPKYRN